MSVKQNVAESTRVDCGRSPPFPAPPDPLRTDERARFNRRMPRKPSPAQRAIQMTFVLKGHLKNAQISYLRVATGLAAMRDQRLFAALRHDSIETYARERLGLGRAAVYRYLQIHDWVREFHPGWLAKKPKGFIPELSDAYALMWVDRRLASTAPDAPERRELEKLRRKALSGQLTQDEFEAVQGGARRERTPLDALLASLRATRRRAKAARSIPRDLLADLDRLVERVEALVEATKQVARIVTRSERVRVAVA